MQGSTSRNSILSIEDNIPKKRQSLLELDTFEKGCYYSDTDSDSLVEKRQRYTPVFKMKLARLAKFNLARTVGDTYGIPFLNVRKWCTQYKKSGPGSFFPGGQVPELKKELITPLNSPLDSPSRTPDAPKFELEEGVTAQPSQTNHPEGEQPAFKEYSEEYMHKNIIVIEESDTIEYTSIQLRLLAAKDALENGVSKVGKAMGLHKGTIRKWMRALKEEGENADVFTNGEARNKPRIHHPPELKLEVAKLAMKECCRIVGEKYGVNSNTVSTWKALYIREGAKSFFFNPYS